jgi:membrane-bound inhibitor of C-type lysozyme
MSHPLPMALALAMSFSCFSSCDRPYVETAGSPMVHSSIVPLAISGERSYRVRVALQPKSMWAGSHSEPVAIDSRVDGEVTLGALLRVQHHEALPATTATPIEATFNCGDVRVIARFAGEFLQLTLPDETLKLHQGISASGARYISHGDPETIFWNKGNSAKLEVRGRVYPVCFETSADSDTVSVLIAPLWPSN